ncbi:hypothetical protein, partial [Robinsoniella peoriensis]|uniref:hypothetical protein n=1 Tax=Robinsoniella peoriensis TaxID=180332 RepID=UPI00374FDC11
HGTGTDKASEIYISSIKTPYDKDNGEYQISFILDESVECLMIGIKLGSDDDNMTRAEISHASTNGKSLIIKNGMVEMGAGSEGEKKILRVKLAESDRKTLEVRAYAKH